MNELDLVLAWLASVAGADCGICNLINNSFDNVLNLAVGTAGTAGAVVGTVVGGATSAVNRIGDAARDAGDAFNRNYDQASGGTGSTPAPSGTVTAGPPEVQTQFAPVPGPPQVGGPWYGPYPSTPPQGGSPGPGAPPPSTQTPGGTLTYFNTGAPAGPHVGPLP
jgi:hypothetical protein